MAKWMKKLALHYDNMRSRYPEDKLLILFDIDGTILDMRHMIFHVLKSYDRLHSTGYLDDLRFSDIRNHENQVAPLLEKLGIPSGKAEEINRWYLDTRWTSNAILESHRPFSGVMEVMRWFQIQPNTYVGLNTGRPEEIRSETLCSLNRLGEEYKVSFSNDLLYMNFDGWNQRIEESKVNGVRRFQEAGYRVFAFVDNEPANLDAVSRECGDDDILLLHADTIFHSKRNRLPRRSVSGKTYDLTELAHEPALPQHIQFVWHGVNDEANLRQFLASNVVWGEMDVRSDPSQKDAILRHDSFDTTPASEGERFIHLQEALEAINRFGKSIKLDLKENGSTLAGVLKIVKAVDMDDSRLWINSEIEVLGEEGFRAAASAFPNAILQCSIDFIAPLIVVLPEKANELLQTFAGWGINRFSLDWHAARKKRILDQLDVWGYEVNIYNVPDLESFLRAVLLLPKSITSDFNFPLWRYYGRGSGASGEHHEYSLRRQLTRLVR